MFRRIVQRQNGFTLVELLIVVVIIAILASITIVSYNGIQDRARYSVEQNDIDTINKAILLYQAQYGVYPHRGTAGGNVITQQGTSVPFTTLDDNFVPEFLSKVPTPPGDQTNNYYAYIYTAGGADYKIVRLTTTSALLPSVEASNPNPDSHRPGRGWGIWSPGGVGI